MKPVLLIIGIVLLVFGVSATAWTWYDAAVHNRISDGLAYAGPVFLVLGALRMVRAASVVPLPSLVRIAVVGLAILLGYGNSAAVKAAFPQALPEVSTNTP